MLSNRSGITKLQEGVSRKLEENRERERQMLEHKKEYKKLEDRLGTMADRLSYDVMVPFTTKAFMPGQLVHTNEVMVLLGDNYFIETSAKHAREICGRRIQNCDKMLEELRKELELVEGWRKQTSQLREEGEQCTDITEEYTEVQLEEWRKQHRESMKREREREKENARLNEKTDEDLWRRLEELEVREALEKEWDKGEEEEQEEEEDVEEDLSDDEEEEESSGSEDDGYVEPPVTDEDIRILASERRVSFADGKAHTAVGQIRFSHSDSLSELCGESQYPTHPGEMSSLVPEAEQPRSILKVPSDFNPADFIKPEVPQPVPSLPSFVDPVHTTVQEKDPVHKYNHEKVVISNSEHLEEDRKEPERKRVSKFKSMRAQL